MTTSDVAAQLEPAPDALPVVVVGGGPTGVSVAGLLVARGIPTLVLERWPDVYALPRAVHLDDEVYRVLDRLGLAEQFARISRPSRGLRLLDRRHRVLAEFDRSGPSRASGHPRASMFDQPELERLLRDHLRGQPLAELRSGVEVRSVTLGAEHSRLELVDVATGAVSYVDARFVLGCDGANSVVREAMGARYRDLGFEQRWLVVDVDCASDLTQWEGVHQVCDPRRAATYMRVGRTRYRWEFQLHDHETAADFATVTDLRPLLEPWVSGVPSSALSLVRVAEYTFRAQVADRWRRHGAFLLGDAAHLTPPFIGQGLGAGLRDAANLAWKLAGVLEGSLSPAWLDTYEAERAPHATALVELARGMGQVMTAGGRPGELVRRLLAPRLARVPGLRDRLVEGESPALAVPGAGGRSPDRLPGHLAPHLPLRAGGSERLDDVAGPGWALVSQVAVAPGERQELERRGCRVLIVERESPLGGWLTGGRADAALVRPDRTVQVAHAEAHQVAAAALTLLTYGNLVLAS